MADVYSSTSTLSALVKAALDREIRSALRHSPVWRSLADVRPRQVNMPGTSVDIYKYPDLGVAKTPLNEITDPEFVGLGNPVAVTIPLNEYGNVTNVTFKAGKTSFSDIQPYQLSQVAWNMRDTVDELVRDALSAGTQVARAGGVAATNLIEDANVISSALIRASVATLRASAVQGRIGELYQGFLHPHVAHDLRAETGPFQETHKYAAPDVFWPATVGVYEGVAWVETGRARKRADAGGTNTDVYDTLVVGKEALAEAIGKEFQGEVGTIADRLNRQMPVGWHGFGGWKVFREEALYRIESASTLGVVGVG